MEEITLITVGPQQVVGIKKTGTYAMIPELLMQLWGFIEQNRITCAGAPAFVCHEISPEAVKEANNTGTAMVEVVWPVTGPAHGSGDISVYELPGGKMVRAVHHGPYETCEPTYQKLFAWICERNLHITGPVREFYPNDPRAVKPEEILTEIFVPVS
ncbi:MAG TPA: GyrI-like domain-containing protein [Methanoregula sp.]|nr:GyrI-like domain-containing protein [Methanoregula sp.]